MTKAKMDWKHLVLELDGHANAAAYGHDIVCAAESMLTQALLQTLIDMEREKKTGMSWTGSPTAGYLRIEAAPAEEHRTEVQACFRMCWTGLKMIAEKYPSYITTKEE